MKYGEDSGNEIKGNLRERIKAARIKRGLTVRALAGEIGIGHMTLYRVEQGITKPDYYTRRNIEQWLKTDNGHGVSPRHSYDYRIGDAEKRISKLEEKVFKGKKKP